MSNMVPRALIGPVLAMARGPTRPPIEALLVRQAVSNALPGTPREPLARDLARRVVEELTAYLAEGDDPLLAAIGDARRKVCPSPAIDLAVSAEIDTLSTFIDLRVERLRARCGRGLTGEADAAERRAIMIEVEAKLTGRYLRHLRR